MPSVAIIGSFRRHYQQVLQAREIFQANGFTVNTPLGNPVLDENALFVRFDEEFEGEDDPTVQSYVLHRIMRADALYVVLPGRYIGAPPPTRSDESSKPNGTSTSAKNLMTCPFACRRSTWSAPSSWPTSFSARMASWEACMLRARTGARYWNGGC